MKTYNSDFEEWYKKSNEDCTQHGYPYTELVKESMFIAWKASKEFYTPENSALYLEFKSIYHDIDKWKWIIKNKSKVIVILDNDVTSAYFLDEYVDDNKHILEFDDFIGNTCGLSNLLEALGIEFDLV